jgi:hypothetical protein
MIKNIDIDKFKKKAALDNRYAKQLTRLKSQRIQIDCIETAVKRAIANLAKTRTASVVIYGEPQSGKTEMMICLTAKLLDRSHRLIVHLMNDSVDLLTQNLKRFKASGLAPGAKNSSEVINSAVDTSAQEIVVFCKKNANDLEKLIRKLKNEKNIVIIDDEADYATPNSKINQKKKTRINELVGKLIGPSGYYVGVTATPARLNLNQTFGNESEKWVEFPAHKKYTGQDVFFPLNKKVPYRLIRLRNAGGAADAENALLRFLVTSAFLNTSVNQTEKNYTFLVHTSGRPKIHEADRRTVEKAAAALSNSASAQFDQLIRRVYLLAQQLYPAADPDVITEYVVANSSRTSLVVLNSKRDRKAAGDNPTEPTSPFTVIIGGNIISRGVTFPNLLAMFFTRNVAHKIQQDTYIQRARMFGARGEYLEHFELTIPGQLYDDWHRCFVFHKLALATVKSDIGSPVWLGDRRISIAAKASINKATVVFNKGEMSFQRFNYSPKLDDIVLGDQLSVKTLEKLRKKVGPDALPQFLIDFIETLLELNPKSLVVHPSTSIAGQKSADVDQEAISRQRGFMGKSQLEVKKFPNAIHHVKIFYNRKGKAKVFYKMGAIQFVQNQA